jgi:cell shape-determining protein MreD
VSYYIGVPLVVITALAEVAFLPYFRVFGLQPNLLLVVLLAWLMVRGQEEALYLIPIGAIVLGLVDGAALGVGLLALAPLALLHDIRGSQLSEGQFLNAVVFTIAATVVYQATYLVAFGVGGEAGNIPSAVSRVVVPVALLNVAVLLPVYWSTWVFSPDVRRTMFA